VQVTLDTNVVGPLVAPTCYEGHPDREALFYLLSQIQAGSLQAFVSQSTLGLEALDRHARINQFFRQWARRPPRSIRPPKPAPIRTAILSKALELGIKVLRVPRIALGTFVDVPDSAWAEDVTYTAGERQSRAAAFVSAFAGTGLERIQALGANLALLHKVVTSTPLILPADVQPEDLCWLQGIVAEYDHPRMFLSAELFSRRLRDFIGEWSDIDMLSASYGYGIHTICTLDRARGAGSDAILHPSKLPGLQQTYGLVVTSPRELATSLGYTE